MVRMVSCRAPDGTTVELDRRRDDATTLQRLAGGALTGPRPRSRSGLRPGSSARFRLRSAAGLSSTAGRVPAAGLEPRSRSSLPRVVWSFSIDPPITVLSDLCISPGRRFGPGSAPPARLPRTAADRPGRSVLPPAPPLALPQALRSLPRLPPGLPVRAKRDGPTAKWFSIWLSGLPDFIKSW